jgi:stage II sporulation protein AB (anti-sigma F factor)
MIPTYRATFTNEPRNVALARNAIASFARLCGFDDEATSDIKLAAGEALSNASEYGRGRRNGGYSVSCSFDNNDLRIEIQDSGEGFDEPQECAEIGPDERNRGFGIFIMRRLMDSVSFAKNGTRVRMVRTIKDDELRTPNGPPSAPTHPHHHHG